MARIVRQSVNRKVVMVAAGVADALPIACVDRSVAMLVCVSVNVGTASVAGCDTHLKYVQKISA